MPSITNAGGSVTSALVLMALAWGVRWLRAELNKSKPEQQAEGGGPKSLGRFYARLLPASLRLLVETGAYPHVILDVRGDPAPPLPAELRGALRLPVKDVGPALASVEAWEARFRGVPCPLHHALLVFVGDTEPEQDAAAVAAAARGYQRTVTLDGGLPGFLAGAPMQPDLTFISRDALAVLLSGALGGADPRPGGTGGGVTVIDVRRADEHALYGAIRGTQHLPVDQLPAALRLPPDEFEGRYGFPKPVPGSSDIVVMSCRTHLRAAWAAQVAKDAGLTRCLVHRQGAYGWRYDPAVRPYRGYRLGEPPPPPEPYVLEAPALEAGVQELARLGLAF